MFAFNFCSRSYSTTEVSIIFVNQTNRFVNVLSQLQDDTEDKQDEDFVEGLENAVQQEDMVPEVSTEIQEPIGFELRICFCRQIVVMKM